MAERNVKEIIMDTKTKKGSVHDIMEQRKNSLAQELEASQIERVLAEEEQKKLEAQRRVDALRRGEPSPPQVQSSSPSSTTDAKTVLDAVKTGVEVAKAQSNNTSDTKNMLEAIKVGIEAAKAQNTAPQGNMAETLIKETLAELKATREENARERALRIEKEIAEIKMRPSAMEEIARDAEKFSTYRKMFGGTDSATANEYTLKKLEMEQSERLEDRKIGFEEKKWEWQKANEGKTIEQVKDLVKTVGEGPIGKAIENLGGGAADRIRGGGSLVKVQCPNCKGMFAVNPALSIVSCIHCGTQLSREQPSSSPAPAEQLKTQVNQQETQTNVQQPEQPPPSQ